LTAFFYCAAAGLATPGETPMRKAARLEALAPTELKGLLEICAFLRLHATVVRQGIDHGVL
jgi:hypothetical protein